MFTTVFVLLMTSLTDRTISVQEVHTQYYYSSSGPALYNVDIKTVEIGSKRVCRTGRTMEGRRSSGSRQGDDCWQIDQGMLMAILKIPQYF